MCITPNVIIKFNDFAVRLIVQSKNKHNLNCFNSFKEGLS